MTGMCTRSCGGVCIYAPDEHKAREGSLLADLDSRLEGAVQSVESRAADAELAARRAQRDLCWPHGSSARFALAGDSLHSAMATQRTARRRAG